MPASFSERRVDFDLTINRRGALAGASIKTSQGGKRLCDDKIISTFSEQAEAVFSRNDAYKDAEQSILDVINSETSPDKPVCYESGGFTRSGELEPLQVTTMPVNPDDAPRAAPDAPPAIVALFPARKIRCVVDRMPWTIRSRASMTACALQQQEGLAKVWWTFEGVPDSDPFDRPSERQALSFFKVTELMADAAIPRLRTAFKQSLADVVDNKIREFDPEKDAIRISMADTDAGPVGALLDALYFRDCHPSDIRSGRTDSDALQGLDAFEQFVRTIANVDSPIADSNVSTNDSAPEARAVLFTDNVRSVLTVAGFARYAGPSIELRFLSPKHQAAEKADEFLRSTSPARSISARIASDQAAILEGRARTRMAQAHIG